jgi:hypothetical protein
VRDADASEADAPDVDAPGADAPEDDSGAAGQGPSLDTSVPNIARAHDYLLGGKNNFAADRAAAEMVIAAYPGIVAGIRANRAFLGRAVRYLAGEAGIRQFIDIGPGMPAADSTHEVAQSVAPESRIVYVDNDPVVLSHARALLRSSPEGASGYIEADLRDVGKILTEAAQTLDLSQPVAIMLLAILHFIPGDHAYEPVSALLADVAPGSFLTISHIAKDIEPEAVNEIVRRTRETKAPHMIYPRTRDEVARFFTSLELAEPGVVALEEWRPDSEFAAKNHAAGWCGVARKPLAASRLGLG